METQLPFQYVSDLHLEYYTREGAATLVRRIVEAPTARYLFLAGDIGYPFEEHYEDALRLASGAYDRCFLIPGNHEFYQIDRGHVGDAFQPKTTEQIRARIASICSNLPNVTFLDNTGFDLHLPHTDKMVRVIGTTLWYRCSNACEKYIAETSLSDYRFTYVASSDPTLQPTKLTPDIVNAWHKDSLAFLHTELTTAHENRVPCIVMTHHLPSKQLISPMYRNSPLNFAFATALDHLFTSTTAV